jgi:hypothetical protein
MTNIIKFIKFIKFINIAGVLLAAGQMPAGDWHSTTEAERTQRSLGMNSAFSAVSALQNGPAGVQSCRRLWTACHTIATPPNMNCAHGRRRG